MVNLAFLYVKEILFYYYKMSNLAKLHCYYSYLKLFLNVFINYKGENMIE